MATYPESLNQDAQTIKTPAVYDSDVKQWVMLSQLLLRNNAGQLTKAQLDAFNRFAATVYALDGDIDSLGARADAAELDPAKAATAISILKGLLQQSLGLGKDATLQDIQAALGVLNTKDFAKQETLAQVLAKLADPATAAKQDAAKGVLDTISSAVAQRATEQTLAQIKAALTDGSLKAQLSGNNVVYATDGAIDSLGARADVAQTDTTQAATAIALLKGLIALGKTVGTKQTLGEIKTALTDGTQKVALTGNRARIGAPPATGVKTVTATAAEVFAGASRKSGRSRLEIANRHSALTIRVGPAGVTDTTGRSVGPLATLTLDLDPTADVPIYAVSEAGAVPVEVFEA